MISQHAAAFFFNVYKDREEKHFFESSKHPVGSFNNALEPN